MAASSDQTQKNVSVDYSAIIPSLGEDWNKIHPVFASWAARGYNDLKTLLWVRWMLAPAQGKLVRVNASDASVYWISA